MELQNLFPVLLSWFLSHGIKIIGIVIVAFLINRFANNFISKIVSAYIRKSREIGITKKITEMNEKRVKTLVGVFTSFLGTVVWLIAVLMILPEFGINIGPLLAGIGLVGLALGMGAKSLIQDYLTGLFILLEDQYRIGEEVEISGKKGKVEDLNLRRTVLKDSEGKLYFIPSGQIKFTINFSRLKTRDLN